MNVHAFLFGDSASPFRVKHIPQDITETCLAEPLLRLCLGVDAASIPALAQLTPEQAAFTANNFIPTNYLWNLPA